MITIVSQYDGFIRAGVRHSSQPASYSDNFFSLQQLAELEADPALVVVRTSDTPPAQTDSGTDSSAAVADGAQAAADSDTPGAAAEPAPAEKPAPKKRGKT